jgi:hypothetical protein
MVGFIILLFVMIGLWSILLGAADTSEISRNWPKHRCEPTVMAFASFYGHDTTENFQFCLKNIMNNEASGILSPIFQILGTFLSTLSNLMNVANSVRLEFATFMGGINTIFQNFTDRISQLTFKIQSTAVRMKMLMGRLYATFYSLMFMSMSGIRALQNFTDTELFKFLDTFCFDPDTLVSVKGRGLVPVKNVKIGDVFTQTGGRVTSTFLFEADGQPMVDMGKNKIRVSTNHYVHLEDTPVVMKSKDHPDAIKAPDWSGGTSKPLVCFNTSDHIIPVAGYRFVDYDETEDGDSETMKWVDESLNAKQTGTHYKNGTYTTAVEEKTQIRLGDGSFVPISNLSLGQKLSSGKVIGLVKKEVKEVCKLPSGELVSSGNLIWFPSDRCWKRAFEEFDTEVLENPEVYYSVICSPSGSFETKGGHMLRDYLEVHSPEAESFYAKQLEFET